MTILKTLMVAPLALLLAMPAYAHDYGTRGYSGNDKRVEQRQKYHHKKHHRLERGHHYGWHKRPYGLYKKRYDWHRKPYYGYHRPRYSLFDDDGWELILRLSDDF